LINRHSERILNAIINVIKTFTKRVPLGKMQQAFRLTTNMMTMVMTMTLKMTRMVMMTRTRHDDDDNDDINLLILQLVHFVVNGMTAEVQCLASENLDCLRTLLVSTEYCLVE